MVKRFEKKVNSLKHNLDLFNGFPYYVPENLEDADYCLPPDRHFNNRGHKKFADFMLSVLKENNYLPVQNEPENSTHR